MRHTYNSLYSKFESIFGKINSFTNQVEDNIKGKAKCILLLLVLLVVGLILFVFNLKTPLVLDDFHYSFGLNGRIASFVDILQTQYQHYFSWGGRSVVHIIGQWLLYISPLLADVLNSLAYVAYIVLMYYHAIGRSKAHSLFILIAISMLTFVFQPAFGETCLWLIGSANYLWGTCIILAFLLPYRFYRGKESSGGAVKFLLMLIAGILAGWTNENTAAALIVMQILFTLSYRLRDIKIPAWAIAGLIASVVGYLFMILAPGNYVRSEIIGTAGSITIPSVFKSFLFATLQIVETLGVINLVLIASLVVLVETTKDRIAKANTIMLTIIYTLGALVCLYVMVFSPFFPTRSWFGVTTFNIIALAIVLYNIDYSIAYLRRIRMYSTILLFLFFVKVSYEAYSDISATNDMWKKREAVIEANRKTGETSRFELTFQKTRFTTSDTEFLSDPVSKYYEAKVSIEAVTNDSIPSL